MRSRLAIQETGLAESSVSQSQEMKSETCSRELESATSELEGSSERRVEMDLSSNNAFESRTQSEMCDDSFVPLPLMNPHPHPPLRLMKKWDTMKLVEVGSVKAQSSATRNANTRTSSKNCEIIVEEREKVKPNIQTLFFILIRKHALRKQNERRAAPISGNLYRDF